MTSGQMNDEIRPVKFQLAANRIKRDHHVHIKVDSLQIFKFANEGAF